MKISTVHKCGRESWTYSSSLNAIQWFTSLRSWFYRSGFMGQTQNFTFPTQVNQTPRNLIATTSNHTKTNIWLFLREFIRAEYESGLLCFFLFIFDQVTFFRFKYDLIKTQHPWNMKHVWYITFSLSMRSSWILSLTHAYEKIYLLKNINHLNKS